MVLRAQHYEACLQLTQTHNADLEAECPARVTVSEFPTSCLQARAFQAHVPAFKYAKK